VGLALDNSDNLWVTNAGSSIFYKVDPRNDKITEFVTSTASPRVYGSNNNNYTENTIENQSNSTTSEALNRNVYKLPYWVKSAPDGSLWVNEQEGNMVARFDPHTAKLRILDSNTEQNLGKLSKNLRKQYRS
jgi:streptogramin lyase